MRNEPRVGSNLAGADLKLQFHRRAVAVACDTALANIGRTLGEAPDKREHSRPCLPHTASLTVPLAIDDVRASVVGVGVDQGKSVVLFTPRFNMRQEMKLRLLGHPGGLPECCDKLTGAGNKLKGITDAEPTGVAVPPRRHTRTLHQGLA